jgi:hypothetical protein
MSSVPRSNSSLVLATIPSLDVLWVGLESRIFTLETQGEKGELEGARIQTYYQNTVASPVFSMSFQRYLRAMLLEDVGCLDEAIHWYGSFDRIPMFDLVFLAHLRRAEIYDRRGQLDQAARHYARFVEIWSDCDPELRPIVDRAEQRLSELAGNS